MGFKNTLNKSIYNIAKYKRNHNINQKNFPPRLATLASAFTIILFDPQILNFLAITRFVRTDLLVSIEELLALNQ